MLNLEAKNDSLGKRGPGGRGGGGENCTEEDPAVTGFYHCSVMAKTVLASGRLSRHIS